jgi:hypothetical protein
MRQRSQPQYSNRDHPNAKMGSILLPSPGTVLTLTGSFRSELGCLSTASSTFPHKKYNDLLLQHSKILLISQRVLTRSDDEQSVFVAVSWGLVGFPTSITVFRVWTLMQLPPTTHDLILLFYFSTTTCHEHFCYYIWSAADSRVSKDNPALFAHSSYIAKCTSALMSFKSNPQ